MEMNKILISFFKADDFDVTAVDMSYYLVDLFSLTLSSNNYYPAKL